MNSKDEKIYSKTKRFLEKRKDPDILEKLEIIDKILNIKDKEKRINYLYDLICDYIDDKIKNKNICDFKCDICIKRRDMINRGIKKDTYKNGCCYSYMNNEDCKYLKDKECTIKNIACKLHTCYYLKKRGYNYKLNDIYLVRYFFNYRQKFYMENTYFTPKEEIIKGIMKRG